MLEERLLMSSVELDRLGVIRQVVEKRLKQREAASVLGLSVRQVKRLLARYRSEGAAGLVSRHVSRTPTHVIAEEVKAAVLGLLRERYVDFGPTLAREKLVEVHGYGVSVETVRQWMIEAGLWRVKSRRSVTVHQRRLRRACVGELIQADGSDHAWFEGRGPRCTLLVYADDATGGLLLLRFVAAETTRAYMETMHSYVCTYGRPVALYTDKHSIFRVNQAGCEGELTQFTRALRSLDITPIHAHSPQAKGRVERANGTLQDRLVKELRLQGIDDMATANAWLPTFMADYNRRFAVAPASEVDAHRALLHDAGELALVFSVHTSRKLSKNLTFQYRNTEYQLTAPQPGYRLRGAQVTVCHGWDDTVTVLREGRRLPFRVLAEGDTPVPLHDDKTVNAAVDQAGRQQRARPRYKPPLDHPWNQMARRAVAVAAARKGNL